MTPSELKSLTNGSIWITGSGKGFFNRAAFAALKEDGSVITWGADQYGGDSSLVAENLQTGVTAVYSSRNAFAALKEDGSVVTWGHEGMGGDSGLVAEELTHGVETLFSTEQAFAALKEDGSVVTWGGSAGGDSSAVAHALMSGVESIYSSSWAFSAFKEDGSVVSWGSFGRFGETTQAPPALSGEIIKVTTTENAFAALTDDGVVTVWGAHGFGADTTSVDDLINEGVKDIFANGSAFAALKEDGSVVAWGDADGGGDASTVASDLREGVVRVYATGAAFAALKEDGSVVVWGDASAGGDAADVSDRLQEGVFSLHATQSAFTALRNDGSAVSWGAAHLSEHVQQEISADVLSVYANSHAFAALKSDGSVVTWGGGVSSGSNSGAVREELHDDVVAVFPGASAFAALKGDGSVVTWGNDGRGGDSSSVAEDLAGGVVSMAAPTDIPQRGVSLPPPAPVFDIDTADLAVNPTEPFRIVGEAEPGAQVTIRIGDAVLVTEADDAGAWEAVFEPADMPDDGTYRLTAQVELNGFTGPPASIDVTLDADHGLPVDTGPGDSSAWVLPATNMAGDYSVWRYGTGGAIPNEYANAALKDDGSVVTWGRTTFGGDSSVVADQLQSGVERIVTGPRGFAALKDDGSVVYWGNYRETWYDEGAPTADYGDYVFFEEVEDRLADGVVQIYSNRSAFAALKEDGSVVVWGWHHSGASLELNPDLTRFPGGTIGLEAALSSGVVEVYGGNRQFAALKEDDSVVTWGRSEYEALIPGQPDNPIVTIFTAGGMFSGLRSDGSLDPLWHPSFAERVGSMPWGHSEAIDAQLQSGVVALKATTSGYNGDMAALKSDGSVVSWTWDTVYPHSDAALGQEVAADLASGVVSIHANRYSFAALKEDGSVVAWKGTRFHPLHNKDDYVESVTVQRELSGGVVSISSTELAFAALKEDGSVVTWGMPSFGGTSEIRYQYYEGNRDVSEDLRDGVVAVYANHYAFAALKDDGSVVTWGSPGRGGDILWPGNGFRDGPEALQEALSSGVTAIYPTYSGFSALKEDGSVVGWGSYRPSQHDDDLLASLSGGVVELATPFEVDPARMSPLARGADGPQIVGDVAGTLFQADPDTHDLRGNVTIMNVEPGQEVFTTMEPSALAGDYGGFDFDPETGAWAYALDNDLDAVQALPAGVEVTDSLTVTSLDGSASETITVTITGANPPDPATPDPETDDPELGTEPAVAGVVTDRGGSALDGVEITFVPDDGDGHSADADGSGFFSFEVGTGLSGHLHATRRYDPETDGRPSALDALDVLRLAVGLSPSFGVAPPEAFIAADMNGDSQISALDALEVLRAAVGLESENAPRWVFVDADADRSHVSRDSVDYYTGITVDALTEDMEVSITGILIGSMQEFA